MSAPGDIPEPLEPLDADLRKLIEREAASHDESAVVARELERLEARLRTLPVEVAPAANVVPLRSRRFAVVASSVGGGLMAIAAMWLLFIHPRQSSPFARQSESAAAAPAADTPSPAAASAALPASPADGLPPAPMPVATASPPAAGPKQAAAAPSRSLDAGAPTPKPKPKGK